MPISMPTGRPLGWVSEKWFVRNKISAAKQIYLVEDDNRFNYKDAISYVTDAHGTMVDPANGAVKASLSGDKLTFTYGKAKTTVELVKTANPNRNLKPAVSVKKGPKEVASTRSTPAAPRTGTPPTAMAQRPAATAGPAAA